MNSELIEYLICTNKVAYYHYFRFFFLTSLLFQS